MVQIILNLISSPMIYVPAVAFAAYGIAYLVATLSHESD